MLAEQKPVSNTYKRHMLRCRHILKRLGRQTSSTGWTDSFDDITSVVQGNEMLKKGRSSRILSASSPSAWCITPLSYLNSDLHSPDLSELLAAHFYTFEKLCTIIYFDWIISSPANSFSFRERKRKRRYVGKKRCGKRPSAVLQRRVKSEWN